MRKPDFVQRVEDKIDEKAAPEHPRRYVDTDTPSSDVEVLHEEQVREAQHFGMFPWILMSEGQFKGMAAGIVVGGIFGAIILAPLAFLPISGLAFLWKLLIAMAIGAVGGSTAGAIYWGGRAPEIDGEMTNIHNEPQIASTPRDTKLDEKGR